MRACAAASLFAACLALAGCSETEGADPVDLCASYDFCFTTFAEPNRASRAENPEVSVRFELEEGAERWVLFLTVPDDVEVGDTEIAFRGDGPSAQLRRIDTDTGDGPTLWGESGRLRLERFDDRIVGRGDGIAFDQSLKDPSDGDLEAYVDRLDFDIEITDTGD